MYAFYRKLNDENFEKSLPNNERLFKLNASDKIVLLQNVVRYESQVYDNKSCENKRWL